MIIAYPLEDLRSRTGGKKDARPLYQAKGVPTKVVQIMGNVAILEDNMGERFPANINKLIWYTTGGP